MKDMDKNSYRALHKWIARELDSIKHCEQCGVTGPKLECANISGEYLRDTSDYVKLCTACHTLFDNRLQKVSDTYWERRQETPCSKGHTKGVYRYKIKALNRRGRYSVVCRQCQSERSALWYKRKIELIKGKLV